jgi:hypothetical protein
MVNLLNEELPVLASQSFAQSNSAVGPLLNVLYAVSSTKYETPYYAIFSMLVLIRPAIIQTATVARSRSSR